MNSSPEPSRHAVLEPIDVEVAALLSVGASDDEIAGKCGVTLDGAESRVRRLCERIDAHGHVAVAWCFDHVKCCAGDGRVSAAVVHPRLNVHHDLSPALQEAAALVGRGLTGAEMEDALTLSDGGLHGRVSRLHKVVGLRGRRMVVWAKRHRDCCVLQTRKQG